MSYTVQVFRDSGQWILEVPELRAVGQVRSLAKAEATAKELIALWAEIPADDVTVSLDFSRLDAEALELLQLSRQGEEQAKAMQAQASRRRRDAAKRLVHEVGLSVRDAAKVMGVSYGRIEQLIK